MELEVLYYGNGRGGVAISVDGGEYVVIKTGRRLLLSATAWEEADTEDRSALSPQQEAAIKAAEAAIAAQTETESGVSELVNAYRQRRLRKGETLAGQVIDKTKRQVPASAMILYSDLVDDR